MCFNFFFFILEIKSSYLYLNPKGEIEASILSGWLSSGEQIVLGAVSVEMPENWKQTKIVECKNILHTYN